MRRPIDACLDAAARGTAKPRQPQRHLSAVKGWPGNSKADRQEGARFADAVEHVRWRLWHGQVQRTLELIGDTVAALDAVATVASPAGATAGKVVKLLRGLETYVAWATCWMRISRWNQSSTWKIEPTRRFSQRPRPDGAIAEDRHLGARCCTKVKQHAAQLLVTMATA
jgi:hypothetical protein